MIKQTQDVKMQEILISLNSGMAWCKVSQGGTTGN